MAHRKSLRQAVAGVLKQASASREADPVAVSKSQTGSVKQTKLFSNEQDLNEEPETSEGE